MESAKIIIHADPDLKKLMPLFLDYCQRDVDLIRAALPQGQYEAIYVTGHNMKGVGESYGFAFVTEIGNEMELAARQEDQVKIGDLLEQLADYLKRVEVAYSGDENG